MLVCLATYRDRLAALLEGATELRLFEVRAGGWNLRGFSPRPEDCPAGLARLLSGAGVTILICGGVSAQHLQYLHSNGIEVLPWICGTVPAVLEGVAQGDLSALVMPGCRYERPACLERPEGAGARRKRAARDGAPGRSARACA